MQIENDAAVQEQAVESATQTLVAAEIFTETPPVLTTVFRSIFVDGPKDFFGGIGKFFKRYFVHYKTVAKFFYRPSLKATPFDKKDYQESSQLSFEIVLLLFAAILFMIKQAWIPVNKELLSTYENDITQMLMEFLIFLMLAAAFFVQLLLSVLAGRLLRLLFRVPITRKDSDILFCFLNNSFFSLAALLAFTLRLGVQYDQIENTPTENGIYLLCFFISFCLISVWSFRFAKLNGLSNIKIGLFYLFAILLFTFLYGIGMSAICAFLLGS